jgi:hypothetical protein
MKFEVTRVRAASILIAFIAAGCGGGTSNVGGTSALSPYHVRPNTINVSVTIYNAFDQSIGVAELEPPSCSTPPLQPLPVALTPGQQETTSGYNYCMTEGPTQIQMDWDAKAAYLCTLQITYGVGPEGGGFYFTLTQGGLTTCTLQGDFNTTTVTYAAKADAIRRRH